MKARSLACALILAVVCLLSLSQAAFAETGDAAQGEGLAAVGDVSGEVGEGSASSGDAAQVQTSEDSEEVASDATTSQDPLASELDVPGSSNSESSDGESGAEGCATGSEGAASEADLILGGGSSPAKSNGSTACAQTVDAQEGAAPADGAAAVAEGESGDADQPNQVRALAQAEASVTSGNAKDEPAADAKKRAQAEQDTAPVAHIVYCTHVQKDGWQHYVKDGDMAGTSGRSLRLEGIKIYLADASGDKLSNSKGGVQYQVHVQSIGWQYVTGNDILAGTSGKSKRLEAIRIMLTGDISKYYDVRYRTHVQHDGWQDWVQNGAMSGTSGKGYRLEGIEIELVEKPRAASSGTDGLVGVRYRAHVQKKGWQATVQNATTAGTDGQGLRIEAFGVSLDKGVYSGGIEYRAHVQSRGWQAWKANGSVAGTTGKGLRVEAVQMRLTGKIAENFDIVYRVHVQSVGWQPWAVDGGVAGTSGKSLRVEAIQVKLMKKGSNVSVSEGAYFLASALDPSFVVDVPASSTAEGKQLQVAAYDDDFDQRYRMSKSTGGTYTVQSVTSARYLGDDGGKLTQQDDAPHSDAQKWKVVWNGGYALVNAQTGKVLAISGGKAAKGAKLVTQADSEKRSQRWTLTATSLIPDGVYVIANTDVEEVVDVAGAKRTNGANVDSRAPSGGNNQKFKIVHLGGEVYSIRNVVTGRAVEVAGASGAAGANVQMYTWNASANQKWKAQLTGPATFQFVNVKSGCALSRASSAANANVVQAKADSAKATQQFELVPSSRVKEVVKLGVPAVLQNPQLPTGCESVALTEALKYYGFKLGKTTIADKYMNWSGTDFVYSFMGNPHTNSGFMICAPGITNTANKYLRAQKSSLRATNRTGASFETLLTYIDRGVPVVVWNTMYMGNRGAAQASSHGYTGYSNTHAVTIAGYDPFKKKVLIADPLSGSVWRNQARFKSLYNQMGRQAVTIE